MRLAVLAVVALAALAGCSGFVGSAPDGTVTPAPVPERTPADAENRIAPGLGGASVIDARRLARAHEAAIRNESYVWVERSNASQFNGNGSMLVSAWLRVEHERLYRYRLWTSWSFANTSEYTAGDTRYRREVGRAGYRYYTESASNVTERFGSDAERAVRRYLAVGNATVAATRVDGRRYYRVTGTTDSIPVTGEISNYSVEALIAPSGFVRELSVSYDDVLGDERERIRYQFRYREVGETTVEPPEWARERWPENATLDVGN